MVCNADNLLSTEYVLLIDLVVIKNITLKDLISLSNEKKKLKKMSKSKEVFNKLVIFSKV